MDGSKPCIWLPWPRGGAETAIVAAALLVRMAFWAVLLHDEQRAFVNEDAGQYLALAKNLWTHGVFSDSPGPPFEPNFLRTPLYPAFIAVVGGLTSSWVLAPCLVQVLLSCWMVLLLVRVGRDYFEWPAATWIGVGLLGALDPNSAGFCGMLMSETLFAALWAAAVAVALWTIRTGRFRVGYPSIAALLIAATFTRPIAQLSLPILLAACVWCLSRAVTGAGQRCRPVQQLPAIALAVVIFAAPYELWVARNRHLGGPARFSMAGSYNLFVYGSRMASHARGHYDWPTVKSAWRWELARLEQAYPEAIYRDEAMGRLGRELLLKHWRQTTGEFVVGIPRTFRSLAYEVFLYLGYSDNQMPPLTLSSLRGQWAEQPGLVSLRVGYMIGSAVVYLVAGIGLLVAWRNWRSPAFVIVLVSLAYLTILGSFNSGGRFRVPLMASLLWLLGYGFAEISRRRRLRASP